MNWINAFVVMGSILIPSLIAVALFWGHRKWQDRDGRRSPIENRAIYGAGEQLRKRAEAHGDTIMANLAMLFFLGPYFLAYWALHRVNWSFQLLRYPAGGSIPAKHRPPKFVCSTPRGEELSSWLIAPAACLTRQRPV